VGLEQLLGLVGPLQNLAINLFWMMVINALTILMSAFIPLKTGKVLLFLFGYPIESPVHSVLVGYAVIITLATLYLAFFREAVRKIPAFYRILTFFCAFVKVGVLLAIEITACPFLLGWWLDVCSLDFFATSLGDRLQFFKEAPW
jgi:hypothetical protein